MAAATFLFALAGVNARATYGAQVTADEPQYLLTALSLGEDFDLDISDEIDDERFRHFHEIGLNPQTINVDGSGRRLSPHDPGLPVLLALPMRLGGWQGAKVGLAAIAAATAAVTAWVCVRRFGIGIKTATAVTIGMFVTPPLTGYATQVYPEMPAALATIVGVAALTGERGRPIGVAGVQEAADRGAGVREAANRGAVALAVAVIVILPWLAVKYVPVAAVLGVALLARFEPATNGLKRSVRLAAPALGVLAVSGGLYLLAHQRIYGGWTVYAAGDHFVDGEFLVIGSNPNYPARSHRLLGLLTDREFGLMAWAPAYALAVPGLAVLLRRRPPGWALLIGLIATGWAVATWVALTMHGWWWPGRQVVVSLPVVVVALAAFVDRSPRLFRALLWLCFLAAVNWLWLVIEASTGRRTLIVDFAETTSPLYRAWSVILPDHRSDGFADLALALCWAAVLLIAAVAAWRKAEDLSAQSTQTPTADQAAETIDVADTAVG